MRFCLRSLFLALAIALSGAGAAAARDYIVVSSTDPAIARGQGFDGGVRLTVAPGQSVTLMHASGDVLRLKGMAGGVLVPRRQANQAEADRLAILKVIVSPGDNHGGAVGLRPMRSTRSGICPEAAAVTTLDAVVQVHQGGCTAVAAEALEAWITAHPPTEI